MNAYRRAIDDMIAGRPFDERLEAETEKISHRGYSTGFYFGGKGETGEPKPQSGSEFIAVAAEDGDGEATVEMRSRFAVGDVLEVLSPYDSFGHSFTVEKIIDPDGKSVGVADKVQQLVRINCDVPIHKYDILRRNRSLTARA